MRKVKTEHYYDLLPTLEHRPGDIWSDLPTHGILRLSTAAGLVITPACDLQNRKVETITYLPVVSTHQFFASAFFAATVVGQVNHLVAQLSGPSDVRIPQLGRAAAADELRKMQLRITEFGEKAGNDKSHRLIERISLGVAHLHGSVSTQMQGASLDALRSLFGEKEWGAICEKLVRNSLHSGLHFLPADKQDPDWSGVVAHSVVLFRCPLTAPIEIFELAQDISLSDWGVAMNSIRDATPMAGAFKLRPIKRMRLQSRFMADILSRYIALYGRIGSPDFTQETVRTLSREVGGIE
ncbi:hypothetical protein [Myxococcus fulvus]|uniref:hypothetical protein n=1 Tax=Myxococcus fulvus TaxID=33 RepID=UPI0020C0DCDA|nr:hypothetical protein [Myxococcus fulvus]MCK8504224.1 hypothetical protein [Myxococcus fulvus]